MREYAKYQRQVLQKQVRQLALCSLVMGFQLTLLGALHCEADHLFLQGSSYGEVKSGPSKKMIRFGTNVDLSDWDKWSKQLEELNKLPKFLRVSAVTDALAPHAHTHT